MDHFLNEAIRLISTINIADWLTIIQLYSLYYNTCYFFLYTMFCNSHQLVQRKLNFAVSHCYPMILT